MKRLLGLVIAVALTSVPSCGPGNRELSGPFFREVGRAGGVSRAALARADDATLMDRMDGGVCLIDFDHVPPLDFFLPSRATARSMFYVGAPLTDPDRRLRWDERSGAVGLGTVGDAVGCLTFDADGDADVDLLVQGVGNLQLFLQEGTGAEGNPRRFVERPLSIDVPSSHALVSSAAGDLDGDGDLDLVVGGFIDEARYTPSTMCPPEVPCRLLVDLYPGVRSYLLINQGGGIFIDQTATLAPDLLEEEPTLVLAIADLDADGMAEILVGNDTYGAHDRVLVRIGAVYQDRAMMRGLATDGSGHGVNTMGIAIGDVDGDGILDVTQSAYSSQPTPIWICGTDGFCVDRGRALGTVASQDAVRWSNALFDLDLDGDLDLLEVAGDVFKNTDVTMGMDLPNDVGFAHVDRSRLLIAVEDDMDGERTFRPATSGDALTLPLAARGMGLGDLDDDGRLDAVIGVTDGQPAVFRNVFEGLMPDGTARPGHYLRVVLRGPPGNPAGIGARVEVRPAGTPAAIPQIRLVRAGEGYASTYDPRVHFGLPTADPVDVTVRWPDGAACSAADPCELGTCGDAGRCTLTTTVTAVPVGTVGMAGAGAIEVVAVPP